MVDSRAQTIWHDCAYKHCGGVLKCNCIHIIAMKAMLEYHCKHTTVAIMVNTAAMNKTLHPKRQMASTQVRAQHGGMATGCH